MHPIIYVAALTSQQTYYSQKWQGKCWFILLFYSQSFATRSVHPIFQHGLSSLVLAKLGSLLSWQVSRDSQLFIHAFTCVYARLHLCPHECWVKSWTSCLSVCLRVQTSIWSWAAGAENASAQCYQQQKRNWDERRRYENLIILFCPRCLQTCSTGLTFCLINRK